MTLQVPTITVDDLHAFHAKHFPNASTPEQLLHGVEAEAFEELYDEEDALGYYPDGTKRTLTDEQIAMFRHSEIQAIIRERRRRRDNGDASEEGEAASSPPAMDSGSSCIDPVASGTTASAQSVALEKTDRVRSGRVEKPKGQQWATSSTRTKTRNKKHRNKYKLKKKAERDEREQKRNNREHGDGGDESDEWDPWHQANGPDVQKDDTVALDY
ncbi:hypothetical protein P153DRAFT_382316 [Dothidotthia symphoricarpi CBS 119687]|uniref:Uncharacterized protein n=1 Tax=Dothidotthia symphoricarpi CBS 119687 TaxID=1392245 RepID=A0A6A6AP81_9PLEO|nr:uncharacterized protein P153DRAFT_382316 [Dothidotthia symphoricarpi CBS 119687]KAF2132697.1 hypothetical protein P153DRAFT_382316 [Dothidotthia symphoricarpi CBS 119687]